MSFPLTPINGYEYISVDGITFIYNSSKNAWDILPSGGTLDENIIKLIDNNLLTTLENTIEYNSNFMYSLDNASVRTLTLTDVVSENYSDFFGFGNITVSNLLENIDEYSYSTTTSSTTLTL